jgi:hypothetical protein
MPVSSRNGWGFKSAFAPVTASAVGPVNTVLGNVGVAIQIVAGSAIRLTKLAYRVDLAPDVAPGTVIAPVRWRTIVLLGQLPQDVSIFQAQAFGGAAAHPEIPKNLSDGTPIPTLWDIWSDFSAGDPGLNRLAEVDFSDAGPSVSQGETLTILLTPIIDTLSNALAGAANALMTIAAYGTGEGADAPGASGGGSSDYRSIPRYDVRKG